MEKEKDNRRTVMHKDTAADDARIGPDLLAYGRLIHASQADSHRGAADRESRDHLLRFRADLEERLGRSAATRKLLPPGRGAAVDTDETAVLALAVFRSVGTDCGPPSVASVAEICSAGDMARIIGVRQAAYRLVRRGVLRCVNPGPIPYNAPSSPSSAGRVIPHSSTRGRRWGQGSPGARGRPGRVRGSRPWRNSPAGSPCVWSAWTGSCGTSPPGSSCTCTGRR